MSGMMALQPAAPKFMLGQRVRYIDRHDRLQFGVVLDCEASWFNWGKGSPLIIYKVSHPTYHRGYAYISEARLTAAP